MAFTPYEQAIRFLSRREYSAKELSEKLARKGYLSADIQETLARLQAENLQSESRFAEMLIRTRIAQGKGPRLIIPELKKHLIPDASINQAVKETEVCWKTLAQTVRQQRFGPPPSQLTEKSKQYQFLHYRGFTSEQISAAFITESNG